MTEVDLLYELWGPDFTDLSFYSSAPREIFCRNCFSRIGAYRRPYRDKVRRCKWDVSYANGAGPMLSPKAVALFREVADTAYEIYPIYRNLFAVAEAQILNIVNDDAVWQRERWCDACQDHAIKVVPGDFEIEDGTPISACGFYQSSTTYGSFSSKTPIYLVGPSLGVHLSENFPEVYLKPRRREGARFKQPAAAVRLYSRSG